MTIENIPLSSVSDEHFAGQEKSWKGQRGGENERSYRVKDHKQSLKGKDARVLRKGGAEGKAMGGFQAKGEQHRYKPCSRFCISESYSDFLMH